MIISAQKPFAIVTMLDNDFLHFIYKGLCGFSFVFSTGSITYFHILFADVNKHPGNENGLGNRAILVFVGLEGFTRLGRKAIQVQAVVPVGAANERQTMTTAH